ncbi:uncharacterized protein LOC121052165 [Rosa chinensis]|uniref:uncharacterized protein LOC121052165 n=1 Tax=Rosa chinensis TaxID=74649 RepID=UPI001AD91DFF|nr:uncharacterized protein LOC121052165 [Rosa chinensis]
MGPSRKGGTNPQSSKELSAAEMDYLAQQAVVEAQLQAVHDSVDEIRAAQALIRSENAEIHAQNAEFRSQLLEELRALRTRSDSIPVSPNLLPPSSLPASDPANSRVSFSEPIYPQGLGVLSITPAEVSSAYNPQFVHGFPTSSMHYVHGNSVFGGPLQQGQSSHSSAVPPWQLSSSTPNYQEQNVRPTLPFAVNHYLTSQMSTQSIPSYAPPTYSTIPSSYTRFQQPQLYQAPQPQYPYCQNQFHGGPLPQGPQFQGQSEMDPNLPTMRQMRLEFQTFGDGDPLQWLNKAEQYFELYQILEDKKVSIAAMHLTDEAADVWHLFRHQYPGNWRGFADLLMWEFGSHNQADYQSALIRLNQTGSVSEFKLQFNKYARRAPGFSNDILLACFLGGLKEDIQLM